jgi:phosphoribosyl-AMP cyclohydrolase
MNKDEPPRFAAREDVDIEEGEIFAPKFSEGGVLPAIVTDAETGEVLMLAYMNALALARTIETGEAHYWSRSRGKLWRKGETSGNTQKVVEMRTDCDQDAIWLTVRMAGSGGCCHTGRRSCFYRALPLGQPAGGETRLDMRNGERLFDPEAVYGGRD